MGGDKCKVICDRGIAARFKGKVYKMGVTYAMIYGLETVATK